MRYSFVSIEQFASLMLLRSRKAGMKLIRVRAEGWKHLGRRRSCGGDAGGAEGAVGQLGHFAARSLLLQRSLALRPVLRYASQQSPLVLQPNHTISSMAPHPQNYLIEHINLSFWVKSTKNKQGIIKTFKEMQRYQLL
jgi:hypothetical protein